MPVFVITTVKKPPVFKGHFTLSLDWLLKTGLTVFIYSCAEYVTLVTFTGDIQTLYVPALVK